MLSLSTENINAWEAVRVNDIISKFHLECIAIFSESA